MTAEGYFLRVGGGLVCKVSQKERIDVCMVIVGFRLDSESKSEDTPEEID